MLMPLRSLSEPRTFRTCPSLARYSEHGPTPAGTQLERNLIIQVIGRIYICGLGRAFNMLGDEKIVNGCGQLHRKLAIHDRDTYHEGALAMAAKLVAKEWHSSQDLPDHASTHFFG